LVGVSETEAQIIEIAVNLYLALASHSLVALALCQLNIEIGVLPQAMWGTSQRYLILSIKTVILFEVHSLLSHLSELIKPMKFLPRLLEVTAETQCNRLYRYEFPILNRYEFCFEDTIGRVYEGECQFLSDRVSRLNRQGHVKTFLKHTEAARVGC